MATKERWLIAKARKIPTSVVYRGKTYRFNKKYPTADGADAHAEYLGLSRKQARKPYRGKRPPFKNIKTVIKRVKDEKGRSWFVVYIREL